jgi:hypothetical protein
MYVRKEKTMARLTWLVLAACILTCLPRESDAGDVFTGFQVDDKNQYFIYLGVRTPIVRTSGGTDLFVQATTGGFGYSFKTEGQLRDANVQSLVPSLGITKIIGGWALSALAGPQLRRIEEQQLNASNTIAYQAGVYGQLEAFFGMKNGISSPQDRTLTSIISSGAGYEEKFWPISPRRAVAQPMPAGT